MTLADTATIAMVLEATMIACFGLAWPLANLRMLRSGRPEGKGLAFTTLILAGYLAGATAKLVLAANGHGLQPVFWLYALNTVSVAANLALQWHLTRRTTRLQRPGSVLPRPAG